MSEDKEESQNSEPLTPEQRLDVLEGKVGKNRMILMFVALILIITISSSMTAFMMYFLGDNSPGAGEVNAGDTATSEQQKAKLEQYDIRIAQLSSELKALESRVQNNANTTIQRVLVEQEQAEQKFNDTVRSAIYDLAHMVPGSRSWLELYSEQIDAATLESQQRQEALKALPTSEPVSEKDPFFGED